MIIKKSLKLTAMGLGLATIAITGCKKNEDNKSAAAAKSDRNKPITSKAGLEIITGGDIPLRGCTTYNVNIIDEAGNKTENLSEDIDTNLKVSLTEQSKAKFKLVNGSICAEPTDSASLTSGFPSVKDTAVIMAKYKDLKPVSKEVKVTSAKLKSIAATSNSFEIPLGATIPNTKGFEINAELTDGTASTISNEGYKVELKDKSGAVVDILKFDKGSSKWLITASHVNSVETTPVEKEYSLTVSQNDSASVETNLKIKVINPVIKEYKIAKLKSYIPKDGTVEFGIIAVYTDGTDKRVQDLAGLAITAKVEKEVNGAAKVPASDVTLDATNERISIPSTVSDFSSASNVVYSLNAVISGTNSDINASYNVEQPKDQKFIISEEAPKLALSFKEFDKSVNAYTKAIAGNEAIIAPGGIEYALNVSKELAKLCVKVEPVLTIKGTIITGLSPKIIVNNGEASNDFTFNKANGIICSKQSAKVGHFEPITAKFQEFTSSNNLNIKVGEAVETSRIAFGNTEAKRDFTFKSKESAEKDLIAYYEKSDGTLDSNRKVDSVIANHLTYSITSSGFLTINTKTDKGITTSSLKFKGGDLNAQVADVKLNKPSSTDSVVNSKGETVKLSEIDVDETPVKAIVNIAE